MRLSPSDRGQVWPVNRRNNAGNSRCRSFAAGRERPGWLVAGRKNDLCECLRAAGGTSRGAGGLEGGGRNSVQSHHSPCLHAMSAIVTRDHHRPETVSGHFGRGIPPPPTKDQHRPTPPLLPPCGGAWRSFRGRDLRRGSRHGHRQYHRRRQRITPRVGSARPDLIGNHGYEDMKHRGPREPSAAEPQPKGINTKSRSHEVTKAHEERGTRIHRFRR